jgi:Na+-translocating ferredoxin:NAD+ oxidoreductase RnfG subunit
MAAVLCGAAPARGQAVYFTPRELLGDFFRQSQNVTYKKIDVDAAAQARIGRRLGYSLPHSTYTFFVATSNGKVDGYALIDDEKGEHLPITFAVKLSPEGKVERQEIVTYRESRGDEVRDERFRQQFVGKSARDPLAVNQDIVVVSGATISSRAMATGVRRALVLFDELIKPTQQVVTARR